MTLFINTTIGNNIEIIIKKNNKILVQKKVFAKYKQAEKLLLLIDVLLKKNKLNINKIKEIQVVNKGESFTALRIGVITANVLGYAMNIPVYGTFRNSHSPLRRDCDEVGKFNIVEPIYNKLVAY